VRRCVAEGLRLLADARSNAPSGGEETWQLMLLVSDGHCGEHEEVRRLVRRGREERVMIVFVILDSVAGAGAASDLVTGGQSSGNAATGGAGESILDLKEAVFEEGADGQMKVVTRRYLERFPFEHYLVVRDVRELPGILGRCLRGWFAEVEGR
jgi:midasin